MHKLIAALALFAAACSPPAQTQAAGDAASPAAAPAQASAPAAIDRALLIGSWGDNGDCTQPITFNDDGTFRMPNGGGGRWSVAGDRIVMEGTAGRFERRVTSLNATQLLIGNPDGSIGLSQRC